MAPSTLVLLSITINIIHLLDTKPLAINSFQRIIATEKSKMLDFSSDKNVFVTPANGSWKYSIQSTRLQCGDRSPCKCINVLKRFENSMAKEVLCDPAKHINSNIPNGYQCTQITSSRWLQDGHQLSINGSLYVKIEPKVLGSSCELRLK